MKPIPGYEGYYSISEDGCIFSHAKQRMKIPTPGNRGYLMVQLHRNKSVKNFSVHRLLCMVYLGASVTDYVDHKNGIPTDNRISNLRICSASQSAMNQRRRADNSSGYKGVSLDPTKRLQKRWRAYISGRTIGRYSTAEEAALAYNEAAILQFGEFALINSVKKSVG